MASSSSSVVIWDFLDFNPFIMKHNAVIKRELLRDYWSRAVLYRRHKGFVNLMKNVAPFLEARSYVSSKQKIELPRDFVLKFEPKHVMKNLITKGNSARGFVTTRIEGNEMGDNFKPGCYSTLNARNNLLSLRFIFYNWKVVSCVVFRGCLGKVALIKAKYFDEKHQFTSNASAKAVYLDCAFAAITKAVEVFHMDAFG
ncbi:hypothetical protein L2E82_13649 [Cichorium intybus]|uniref:Uncharacterized protein n=1 Tax=Cichorium intybus TaxID=13427 RepID=A0ACB9EYE1_CICIN|nr:hypothetical protein L2E82_13649 [Cichorium intybus]